MITNLFQKKKKPKCNHLWVFMDKWTDNKGKTWWEFYCQYCLEITTRTDGKGR